MRIELFLSHDLALRLDYNMLVNKGITSSWPLQLLQTATGGITCTPL